MPNYITRLDKGTIVAPVYITERYRIIKIQFGCQANYNHFSTGFAQAIDQIFKHNTASGQKSSSYFPSFNSPDNTNLSISPSILN